MAVFPNGNGAVFDALKKDKEIQKALGGIQYVQIIGTDNVLNKVLDPFFIGYAIKRDLDAALKVCIKREVKEPVGIICKKNGKYAICEPSELADSDFFAMDSNGNLKYNLGSILNFLIKTEKL